jgi:hypothetical protein
LEREGIAGDENPENDPPPDKKNKTDEDDATKKNLS